MLKTFDLSNFGRWLKSELAVRGMTQRELAEATETDDVSISRYISGTRLPRWKTMVKILRELESHIEIWPNSERNKVPGEDEPAEIELEGGGATWWYVCGECHGSVDCTDGFCKHCGRALVRPLAR